jgi:hydroxymethylbilane synthase
VTIRIATRKSPLALWQANHVADALSASDPSLTIELITMDTFADLRLDLPIAELGGKGAFSKEVQNVLLAGAADIAVHSAKDLQALTPAALTIAAVPVRGEPRDALVGSALADLPEGAVVATGSNRRRVQLARLRPDLQFVGLRGNIGTRLSKLDGFDALVMAQAAIERLELVLDTVEVLDAEQMIPQVGQGALAVECRVDDDDLIGRLAAIDHAPSRHMLEAERGFLLELGGDCDLPAGAHATVDEAGALSLTAMLSSDDERRLERVAIAAAEGDPPEALGRSAARQLMERLA